MAFSFLASTAQISGFTCANRTPRGFLCGCYKTRITLHRSSQNTEWSSLTYTDCITFDTMETYLNMYI
ncbi:hypothetical protein CapIbe_023671 [Capra ibex]